MSCGLGLFCMVQVPSFVRCLHSRVCELQLTLWLLCEQNSNK